MSKIIANELYVHFSGSVIIVLAIVKDFKDKAKEHVIYKNLSDKQVYAIPVQDFYTPHPTSGIPRYRLIQPSQIKVK